VNRFVSAVVVVLGACAVHLATAATAGAHAELVSSSPADGAAIAVLPDVVELVFSENVGRPAEVVVVDPGGGTVPGDELQLVGDTVTVALRAGAARDGRYSIGYQVTSADGHPIAGEVSFTVGDPGAGAAAPAPARATTARTTDVAPSTVALLVVVLACALAASLVVVRRLVLDVGHRAP